MADEERRTFRERLGESMRNRLVWAACAVIAFPVGRFLLGKAFPDSGGTRSTIGLGLVLAVAACWAWVEFRSKSD